MGKKMKLPFLVKATENAAAASSSSSSSSASFSASPWLWPSCVNNPKTLSFRSNPNENTYKTMNSAYIDDDEKRTTQFIDAPDSFFSVTNSFERHHCEEISFCVSPEMSEIGEQKHKINDALASAAVIQGLKSNSRLFFEPGETSSILEKAKTHDFPFRESVTILAMDSRDPFLDFRASMEEMAEAHELKDWDCLEELLSCYLRVNEKSNHGYIVGAFVDLLMNLAFTAPVSANDSSNTAIDEHCSSSSTTTHCSFTSPLSFSSSIYSSTCQCLSSLENEDEITIEKNLNNTTTSSSSSFSYKSLNL